MSENAPDFDVVVIGGGITGAAAAFEVHARRPDLRVAVFEGSPRWGGKLASASVGGIEVDTGAEAMLARRPEALDLAAAAGLETVSPVTTSSAIWSRGDLVPLPRTLMGIPGDLKAVREILSPAGRTRAALDRVLPPPRLEDGDDLSVGGLVEDRLGKEVLDRLVEPMLGGVYAGHARELSLRAAIPALAARLDGTRSLVQVVADLQPRRPSAAPVFAGLAGGVHRLPVAVLEASGATLRAETMVRSLTRESGSWLLEVGPTRAVEQVRAGAVLVAIPAANASRLLQEVAPRAARELGGVESASMAVVTMAFASRDFPAVRGSGFLVPPVEEHAIKAATFSFAKWDWVARADPAVRVVRCSIGRHREERLLHRDDAELVALAVSDLHAATGVAVPPIDWQVQRWGGGLPQYAVGHVARVAAIREAVAEVPGLAVAGATYDGVGIPACIASARRAVDALLDRPPR